MPWSDVIGQQRVIETLKRGITSGRVAHAYLFHGPEGVGKYAVALAFSMALECEREASDACGECSACRRVARLVHPDVRVLFPYPKDTPEEDIAERLKHLSEDPYEEIDYVRRPSLTDSGKSSNKQTLYPVDRINEELRRALSFKSHEGRYKIAIVIGADRLRVEAANAFLKLLEEPTPNTVLILTTARPDRLLPTVVSRCQQLRFAPLGVTEIEEALVERAGVERDRAAILGRMSGGSYTRAITLAQDEDLLQQRSIVVDFLRYAYVRHSDRLLDLAEHISRLGREQVKGLLLLMNQWIEDLLLFQVAGVEAAVTNVDQVDSIAKFCANLPEADLERMSELVESSIYLVGRNVHVNLLLVVLADQLAEAMRGVKDVTLPQSLPKFAAAAEDA